MGIFKPLIINSEAIKGLFILAPTYTAYNTLVIIIDSLTAVFNLSLLNTAVGQPNLIELSTLRVSDRRMIN